MTKIIALTAMIAVALTFSSCASKEKRYEGSQTSTTSGSVSYAK